MGLLIGLLIGGVIFFFAVFAVFSSAVDRKAAKAKAQAPQIMDELFAGEPKVAYKIHLTSLPLETVIMGAEERGYRLQHQGPDENGIQTLIFEKT